MCSLPIKITMSNTMPHIIPIKMMMFIELPKQSTTSHNKWVGDKDKPRIRRQSVETGNVKNNQKWEALSYFGLTLCNCIFILFVSKMVWINDDLIHWLADILSQWAVYGYIRQLRAAAPYGLPRVCTRPPMEMGTFLSTCSSSWRDAV